MTAYNQEEINRFLVELYIQTRGDPAEKVSWYDVGEALGMDRTTSSNNAEELIGTGMAEIKTLNGGIAITTDGVAHAKQLGAVVNSTVDEVPFIGEAPVIEPAVCQVVARVTGDLKNQMGKKNLDFDSLARMVAALNAIDAQLSAPKPETSVIREYLLSIKGVLEKTDDTESLVRIKSLLGE